MAGRECALALAASLALGLAGCDGGGGATDNPNAPGRPGTSNPPVVSAPAAPDTPPGGPSGVMGSAPHPGSSGGDAIPGVTGSGTSEAGGRSQTAQPGTGLQGGLGASAGVNPGSTPGGTATSATGQR